MKGHSYNPEGCKKCGKVHVNPFKEKHQTDDAKKRIGRGNSKANRKPREIRICAAPGCYNTFECIVTSDQRYCCRGHNHRIKRETEVRVCAAPKCSNEFSCDTKNPKKYCCRGHASKGKKRTEEFCQERRVTSTLMWKDPAFRSRFMGKNHFNWRGGISKLPYPFDFNEKLRSLIRERDNHTCQLCGIVQEKDGCKLDVHHIDYVKENLDPKNLITLCRSCNAKVNFGRKVWTKFFQSKLRFVV